MPSRPRTRRWQEVDKSDIRLDSAIQSYLMYHEDRNHSPKSVRWYADMLRRFADSLGPEARLGEIDADGIRKYMRSVRERDFSKFTLHGYARSLKTFLRWLEREGYLDEQLSSHVDLPKVPKYEDVTIDVLTDEEIAHLLSVLDPATDVGCRDRAIVCLMLEEWPAPGRGRQPPCGRRARQGDVRQGPRQGRQAGLRPHRPDHAEGAVQVRPQLPRPADPRTTNFFLNMYGEPLKYEAIKSVFERLAKKSGITRLHPHLLRHTAATRMLANGADLHSVQRLLRHSDIRTTLRYLHLVPEQLQEKMRLFSPLAGVAEERQRMVPTRLRRVNRRPRPAIPGRP